MYYNYTKEDASYGVWYDEVKKQLHPNKIWLKIRRKHNTLYPLYHENKSVCEVCKLLIYQYVKKKNT